MVPIRILPLAIRNTVSEWLGLSLKDLRLSEASTALLVVVALAAISLLVLLVHHLRSAKAGRTRVALPAVLPVIERSSRAAYRHAAFLIFATGIPFFAVALADPRVTLAREETVHEGKRIAILIDGSGSMVLPFESPTLRPEFNRTFYTAVAAAERFVRLRMNGGKTDIIALVQFGNEAYVVTPFTTDYENVLLSMRLIGQPSSWNRFNVFGTTIIQGMEQGLQLFKTFDLQSASGNAMVMFSDGNDGETTFRGRTLDELMAGAKQQNIPIYMVRLGYQKRFGEVKWDTLWRSAVERSGGRFYPAPDETAILRAISNIDQQATGRIGVRRYLSAQPGFSGYTLAAVALWLVAGALKLGFRGFRTFP